MPTLWYWTFAEVESGGGRPGSSLSTPFSSPMLCLRSQIPSRIGSRLASSEVFSQEPDSAYS
jgi:hypothetical protein